MVFSAGNWKYLTAGQRRREGQGTGNAAVIRAYVVWNILNLMAEMGEDRIKSPWEEIMYSSYSMHKKVMCSQMNKCSSKYFLNVDLLGQGTKSCLALKKYIWDVCLMLTLNIFLMLVLCFSSNIDGKIEFPTVGGEYIGFAFSKIVSYYQFLVLPWERLLITNAVEF